MYALPLKPGRKQRNFVKTLSVVFYDACCLRPNIEYGFRGSDNIVRKLDGKSLASDEKLYFNDVKIDKLFTGTGVRDGSNPIM